MYQLKNNNWVNIKHHEQFLKQSWVEEETELYM